MTGAGADVSRLGDGPDRTAVGDSARIESRRSMRGVSVKAAASRTRWQRRKRARTRASLNAVALRLFDECGYSSVTTRRIADEAGVSPITLFRYFPAKEDLVIGLFDADGFADRFRRESVRKDAPAVDVVRSFVSVMLGEMEQSSADELAVRMRIIRADDGLTKVVYSRIPDWTTKIMHVVRDDRGGAGSGRSPDSPIAVTMLVSGLVEAMFEWSRRCDAEFRADIDLLVDIMSDACSLLR